MALPPRIFNIYVSIVPFFKSIAKNLPVELPQLFQVGEQLDVGGGAVKAALPQQLHEVLGLHEVHEPLPVTPVLVRLLGHRDEVLDEVLDDEGAAGLVERRDHQVVVDDFVEVSPGPPGMSSDSISRQFSLLKCHACMT